MIKLDLRIPSKKNAALTRKNIEPQKLLPKLNKCKQGGRGIQILGILW